MKISQREWKKYINKLSAINNKAGELVEAYVERHGVDDVDALIEYANAVAYKYGNASAAINAVMYDTMAELEGVTLKAAELASAPTYGDVAKAVQGTMKTSVNAGEIGGAVARLVKRTGQDTMLKNGIRDHAEYAWIPSGDTCAFCIALAANGWQPMSKSALKGGHAEHIHANCDCTYMVRHSKDFNVGGYNPEKYYDMYNDADTSSYGFDENRPKGQNWQNMSQAKINGMRRAEYAKNKDEINAQKRAAYALRTEKDNSSTE